MEELGVTEFKGGKPDGQSRSDRSICATRGQGYELNVPFGPEMAAQFHELHQRRYGFANEARTLEVVNVRVRMVSAAEPFEAKMQPLEEGDGAQALIGTRTGLLRRSVFMRREFTTAELLRPGDTFAGPAIVSEYSSATVLPLGRCSASGRFGQSGDRGACMNEQRTKSAEPDRTGDLSEQHSLHRRGDGSGSATHFDLAEHQGTARLFMRFV